MSTIINLTQENLKDLASKVGGNLWMKGDKIRIYVEGGNNYHYKGKWHYEIAANGSWESKVWLDGGYGNNKSKEYTQKHLAIMDQEMESALNEQTGEGEAIPVPELPISDTINLTMACGPVRVTENPYSGKHNPIKYVANLSDSNMIDHYHGCGEGYAYLNSCGDVVAFRYGIGAIANEPEGLRRVYAEFSCTQICLKSI